MCTGNSSALDPDLAEQYKQASRDTSVKGGLSSTQDVARNNIMQEQKQRDDLRAQNAALAAERTAAQQQAAQQMEELQRQQQAEVVRQEGLTKQFETDRAAQQVQIAGTRAASQAVSQSLRILSAQGTKQAPTAVVAKRKGPQAGPRNTAAALRMGSTSSSAGSGPNIAV